jgi:hypothetical protein
MRIFFFFSSIFIIMVMAFSPQANATTLDPFDKWVQTRPNWHNDETEVAYALTRCGALMGVIGGVFAVNPSSEKDVKTGEDMTKRGTALALFGSMVAQKKGMTQENSVKRFGMLSEAYGKIVRDNRALHNNMFQGFVENDFKFCIGLENILR